MRTVPSFPHPPCHIWLEGFLARGSCDALTSIANGHDLVFCPDQTHDKVNRYADTAQGIHGVRGSMSGTRIASARTLKAERSQMLSGQTLV